MCLTPGYLLDSLQFGGGFDFRVRLEFQHSWKRHLVKVLLSDSNVGRRKITSVNDIPAVSHATSLYAKKMATM